MSLAPDRVPVLTSSRSTRRTPSQPAGAPVPESPVRQLVLRATGVIALVATVAYLVWRVGWTMSDTALWLSVPFLVFELHAAVSLALFVFSAWDVTPVRRPDLPERLPRTAVFITTYDEDLEVLLPTVTAALALEPAHETFVLDDGDRIEVAQMARALGATYVARPVHDHAKAGNLNHALARVEADVVAVLDADHVPEPDFLLALLGYFEDPRVAVVQTPQEFYNTDSFEHTSDPAVHEESLFYRVVQPAKNRWNAAFWCGTNALIRVDALREVGGVATETITEDLHTTLRLHRAGWRTVYHDQVLARGLAAAGPDQFLAQRVRWGRGSMQVLRQDNPLFGRGLTLGQRLAYGYSLSAWFDAWRTFGLALLPVVVLVTGQFPLSAPPEAFLVAFACVFSLQQSALILLGRGRARVGFSLVFDMIRLPANLSATLSLLVPRSHGFSVTPKGRTGDERSRASVPPLLLGLSVLLCAGGLWGVASLLGATATTYASPSAAVVSLAWLAATLGVLTAGIARVRSLRFGVERRDGSRHRAEIAATVDGRPALVTDLSVGGAQLRLAGPGQAHGPDVGDEPVVELLLQDGRSVMLSSTVRSGCGALRRVQFQDHQWREVAAVAALLFEFRLDDDRPALGIAVPQQRRRAEVAQVVA
jgi:cellulose synthase (UDP-forming)